MSHHGEVLDVEELTPGMLRVTLGGPGLDAFEPTPFTDQYVNALFVPDGAPYAVPFDVDEARAGEPAHRPRGRRYTVRAWDPGLRRLYVDFVVHGDVGYAGRWAAGAKPGDTLQFLGPSGGYAPSPDADWHLFVGDESALPAIAASLERLPVARAVVVAVVDDAEHELDLDGGSRLDVVWVHRHDHEGDADALLHAVEDLTFPAGTPEVFVHGEAAEVRSIRRHLHADRHVTVAGASISPYWRRDHTDEQWRAIKRQWLAESEQDLARPGP